MVGVRKRGEEIRQFIWDSVENHPVDLAKFVSEAFNISRQAVNRHIRQLIEKGILGIKGSTRNPHYYRLVLGKNYSMDGTLKEDRVWRADIAPLLADLPNNVIDLWHYGFTEIFNNAIEHSGGNSVRITLKRTASDLSISIEDNGVGIFNKIKNTLNLFDERESVLELAKGKLTTDPSNHSGEGIFFTSRVFDKFLILSGGMIFSHDYGDDRDWIVEKDE